jgi:hypothetical protein
MAVDKEADTKENERYAEKLTHVEEHVLLESHLRFLDELDEETAAETSDEEGSDEESAVEFRETILVHQYLENSEKEVT